MTEVQQDAGVAVTSEVFLANLSGYAKHARLVDAIVGSQNPTADIEEAFSVIESLRSMEASGKGYTPAETLGFGSENASTIAMAILGKRTSTARIRGLARKIGRSA